jgi:hypothetical protein
MLLESYKQKGLIKSPLLIYLVGKEGLRLTSNPADAGFSRARLAVLALAKAKLAQGSDRSSPTKAKQLAFFLFSQEKRPPMVVIFLGGQGGT